MEDYPYTLRRNRINHHLRDMLQDTVVTPKNLMYPVFVRAGEGIANPITSMPGVCQYSCDTLIEHLRPLVAKGLPGIMLFGIIDPSEKDQEGSHICGEDSIISRAIKAIRDAQLDVLIAVDVCFCEYTSHGHCGVPHEVTKVDNSLTVENLGRQAVSLAYAGADMLAPSGMMDGAVAGIRYALDEAGFSHLPIMGYSVKYASACYGPFRDAAESAPGEGNRKQYQQDIRRDTREAILEAEADVLEGADVVMVKPGTLYIDVLSKLREEIDLPLAIYHVSGEYAMLKAAAEKDWIDEEAMLAETLIAFRRAGANIILTYAAPMALEMMAKQGYLA